MEQTGEGVNVGGAIKTSVQNTDVFCAKYSESAFKVIWL